jgi:hypothetical protein
MALLMHAIFALHSIISKSLRQGKRLYCCFIDYVKAFDSVSHFKLWLKLAKCGVTGKLLNIIKSMYAKLKSNVKHDGNFSVVILDSCRGNHCPHLYMLFMAMTLK